MTKETKHSKHTLGPWTAIPGWPGWGVYEDRDGGNEIVTLEYMRLAGGPDPRQEQIARLIAAAPDLLEACKEALQYMESRGRYDTADLAAPIRAAIAKAEELSGA